MAYSFDSISILKDGKRVFPIMGEIHYSRVPRAEWRERLLKMKAGGVTLVSSYVIWIHHEEIEGEFDWTGDRNLREFVSTLNECGMKMLLRIGPWSHGEVRNGGFPDWLLKKGFEPRTNDEAYLDLVKNWYAKIYEQVQGFICDPADDSTSGNPIVGVQIENEYGHCGGLRDKEGGEAHMRKLYSLARATGFNVALYTATGWGGAWTGGLLPVMGGYCDAPWDPRITEIEPSGNYVFTKERNDHNIGSDHGFGYGITFDITQFPYLTAELGGGLQFTAHRRTIATAKDIAAVALTKLGSGVNLLGFYMYAGGTNPEGKLTTLQESRETGYPNDLPIKGYDFRAPVREFGQVSDTLRELKLLAYFALTYEEELCPLGTVIPREVSPDDTETLRYSFRSADESGYLFVNNYVRHQKMSRHEGVQLASPEGSVTFPALSVADGDFFFLPFNVRYGNTLVKTATVSPLTRIGSGEGEVFVFYKREGDSAERGFFELEGGMKSKFLVLSREDALNAWLTEGGRLVITDSASCALSGADGTIEVITRGAGSIAVYPDFERVPTGWKKCGEVNKNAAADLPEVRFACYERETTEKRDVGIISTEKGTASNGASVYTVNLGSLQELLESRPAGSTLSDVFVSFDFTGDRAQLYGFRNGRRTLLLDSFYLGENYPWEVGLRRFVGSGVDFKKLELEIQPLRKDAEIYIEKWPEFSGKEIAVLHSVNYETERRLVLK